MTTAHSQAPHCWFVHRQAHYALTICPNSSKERSTCSCSSAVITVLRRCTSWEVSSDELTSAPSTMLCVPCSCRIRAARSVARCSCSSSPALQPSTHSSSPALQHCTGNARPAWRLRLRMLQPRSCRYQRMLRLSVPLDPRAAGYVEANSQNVSSYRGPLLPMSSENPESDQKIPEKSCPASLYGVILIKLSFPFLPASRQRQRRLWKSHSGIALPPVHRHGLQCPSTFLTLRRYLLYAACYASASWPRSPGWCGAASLWTVPVT